ncbi:MAG: retroviral-like aspartic protease family protein [Duncaniella sp.]|nr:retroviral-like aspartic protease family protein [Duncaniella sp.]
MQNTIKSKHTSILYIILIVMFVSSCEKKLSRPPYNLNKQSNSCISVPYEELEGVKIIPVKLNGITMSLIYDTGCSGLHLSLNEVQTLYKNGRLDQNDILGVSYSTIADGSIVENGTINIKKIEIGGEDGVILENIQATVALNQSAPILLGNTVLDELRAVEIDNLNKTINFYKK